MNGLNRNSIRRLVSNALDGLRRPVLRRRLGRLVVDEVEGVSLVVLPEVFNPRVFRTGAFLARVLQGMPWEGAAAPRVLDLGTGSGVGSVFAALRGWSVVAVDINPQAVRCCRINALVHGLEERIEVREGDLFAPVVEERFDLVLFNPPYFRGTPDSPLDAAWRGLDVLERFATALPSHLAPGGKGLLMLSDHGACDTLVALLEGQKMRVEVTERRDFGNEVLTLYTTSLMTEASP
jgi:release factor glutamine methyltransferase